MQILTAYGLIEATACQCGAISIVMPTGDTYSMTKKDFDKYVPEAYSGDVEEEHYNCNYCVNHWGLDLCGCGSGEKFGECKEGYQECKQRAQSIEDSIVGCSCESAWGTR